MSTGLDCRIEERSDGWYFEIEDPASHRFNPEYNEEGPFATVADLVRAYRRHPNPGGFDLTLLRTPREEFDRQWNEAWRR
ncbi:MAG: hypothetical protein ACJ79H_21685 [Myxococcales bacterium]